jgi:large subunit ribosomal protein L4
VNAILSSRNLPKVKYLPGTGLNIYDILDHETILFSRESILQLQEALAK